jgi:hypothetical protein
MRCAMTDREYADFSDGVWDDGEWISWDWINSQLDEQELISNFPHADPRVVLIFQSLLDSALEYREVTGHYLQIWGELGELYAEIKFGLKRHRPHAQGSDGKIGNDFIEVKTISPEKTGGHVHVKRAGNFSKLLVVRIDENFQFQAKLVDRRALGKGVGKRAKLRWSTEDTGDHSAPIRTTGQKE